MTLRRAAYGKDTVGPERLTVSQREGRYAYDSFGTEIMTMLKGVTGSEPTGSTGDENLMNTGFNTFEWHVLGTQTILTPNLVANGLDVNMDQTDNDGIEVNFGGIIAGHPRTYTVGTDEGFFARLKFSVADVSGTDDCAFGFRKVEAYQANIDDYDEMAVLNVISGAINIETILNGAATSTTDTTDTLADAGTVELEVRVIGTTVHFYIDGAEPTISPAAFNFDSGEVVTPFFYFLNSSDVAGEVALQTFECGLLTGTTGAGGFLGDRPDGTL